MRWLIAAAVMACGPKQAPVAEPPKPPAPTVAEKPHHGPDFVRVWPDRPRLVVKEPLKEPLVLRVPQTGGDGDSCGDFEAKGPSAVIEVLAPQADVHALIKGSQVMYSTEEYDAAGKRSTWSGGSCAVSEQLSLPSLARQPTGTIGLSVIDTRTRKHESYLLVVYQGEAPIDPLEYRTPPASDSLADRALDVRYPFLRGRDLEDELLVERLLRTAPKESFVFAKRDLTDAVLISRLRHDHPRLGYLPYETPKADEPLLWAAHQVITLDGDVFWVPEDALATDPPAKLALPPDRPRNPHAIQMWQVTPEGMTPAYKNVADAFARCEEAATKELDKKMRALDAIPSQQRPATWAQDVAAIEAQKKAAREKKCPVDELAREQAELERLLSYKSELRRRQTLNVVRDRVKKLFAL